MYGGGCVGGWMCGRMNVWEGGCVGWMCGCVDVWDKWMRERIQSM